MARGSSNPADALTVTFKGGPRDGWVYYLADAEAAKACDEYFGRIPRYSPSSTPGEWSYVPRATPPPKPPPEPEVAADAWSPKLPPQPCPRCGDPTYRVMHGRSVLAVDVDMIKGGLYRFDVHGRPVRRPLADAYAARRDGDEPLGYAMHECAAATPTDPRLNDD